MPLFEVAIIQKQTKKEAEDGIGGEKLVLAPKFVMARDGQAAGMKAMLDPNVSKDIDLDRAEVLIRPFA